MLNSLPILSNRIKIQRGFFFGALIVAALIAFEAFNYSTTDFALSDLLGELTFLGIRWATILSIAFCGIDFAGIARLFTPEQASDEPAEVWYLFGAWMLAAVMNAMLTWWGISIALLNHETLGKAVVARETLLNVVPIFVAVMVWLSRVLIIGTISMAGDRLFSQATTRTPVRTSTSSTRVNNSPLTRKPNRSIRPSNNNSRPTPVNKTINASSFQPSPRRSSLYGNESSLPIEPEYTPLDSTHSTVSFSNNRDENRTGQVRL